MKEKALLLLMFLILCSARPVGPEWGFYGHRKINRMAVFSLPWEMFGYYKQNIEFLTVHAVDPDKRRYATRHEAVRHFIDIDHWGENPFEEVPHKYWEAILKYSEPILVKAGDSTRISLEEIKSSFASEDIQLIKSIIEYQPDENPFEIPLSTGDVFYVNDVFTEFGNLPYWLKQYQERLTKAFELNNEKRILRISAEMGHYIGDAHVPLHTTENYNGQMTNQVGIHAFWESRIPELFADAEYDFMVGKAEYIKDLDQYFWDVIEDSHILLKDVLAIEKELTESFPSDKQWCYDDRKEYTLRLQCPEFAKAYALRMDGMVEKRMREAILSLSSLWYTAWVNAGQPDLNVLGKVVLSDEDRKKQKELELQFESGNIFGREHGK